MPELAALSTSTRAGTECEPSLRLFTSAATQAYSMAALLWEKETGRKEQAQQTHLS